MMLSTNLPYGEQAKILQFINDIITDPKALHHLVLTSLHRLFGYDKCIFWSIDKGGNVFDPITYNVHDKVIERYYSKYINMDPMHPQKVLNLLNKKRVIDCKEFKDFKKSEIFNDFLKPFNFYDAIALYLVEGNKLIGVISIMRNPNEKGFNTCDTARLEILGKYVSKLLINHSKLMEKEYELKFFQAHSDQSLIGLIIFDQSFRVHYCNTAAMDYCKELLIKAERWSSIPEQFIRSFLPTDIKDWQLGYIKPILCTSLKRLTIHIVPCINFKPAADEKYRYLLYMQPELTSPLCVDSSRIDLLLTPRERELADLVFQGLSNQEIAENLFISLYTVKSHLQNIFKKLNITSRTELCSKLHKQNIRAI